VLLLASVTDTLVTFATHVIRDLGLPGVFLLVAADAAGIPIAAPAIMLFAGFNVSEGHNTILGITVAGVLGDVFGSTIAYWIGYVGRRELLEKHGRKLHITPQRLKLAEGWFDRYGIPVIFFGRIVPVVRTFISFPAGAARMPYVRFAIATALGAIPLALGFGLIGQAVGSNWVDWKDQLHYVDYAAVAVVGVTIVVLAVRLRSDDEDGDSAGPATDAGG
jgi:membrane protein DedA with SNARE-associated domain